MSGSQSRVLLGKAVERSPPVTGAATRRSTVGLGGLDVSDDEANEDATPCDDSGPARLHAEQRSLAHVLGGRHC